MYLVIVNKDMSVKEIIKDPNEEQKEKGFVINDLTSPEQFYEVDKILYYIKKGVN